MIMANSGKLGFAGKLGGAFATEQYTHGGGTQVIHSILIIEMVNGMLCYSGGVLAENQSFILARLV